MTKPASLLSSRFTHGNHTRHFGPFTSELDRLNISRLGTVFIMEGAPGQEALYIVGAQASRREIIVLSLTKLPPTRRLFDLH